MLSIRTGWCRTGGRTSLTRSGRSTTAAKPLRGSESRCSGTCPDMHKPNPPRGRRTFPALPVAVSPKPSCCPDLAGIDHRLTRRRAPGRRVISPRSPPPPLMSKEDDPPVALTFGTSRMTSLSVDEMPCLIEADRCLLGRCAVNDCTVSRRSRAPPQASRSQLPGMPDFSPKTAENSGPLPRRRIDFM